MERGSVILVTLFNIRNKANVHNTVMWKKPRMFV